MATARPAGSRLPKPRVARAGRAAMVLEAYVLHRYDWSESSLILDLYTRDEGRLAVAAKGAKRPYSQWRSVLLPFQRIFVTLGRAAESDDPNASDVRTLRGADWAGGAPMLTGAALFSGFYLNELLLRLVARHDPHPSLFDSYAATLPALSTNDDADVEAALRAFELTLLRETGLLPDLSVATQTQRPVEPAARYALLPEAGVVPAESAESSSMAGAMLIGLEAALHHGSLEALRQACRVDLPALKRPLRAAIQHQLGTTPLRTRRVMAGLQGL